MSMSQVRTRKRPAPGSSPLDTAPSTNHNTTGITQSTGASPMATNQYLQWPPQNRNSYPDPSNSYESSPYNETGHSHGLPMTPSDQLATRSTSQQLVPRADYNGLNNGTWPVLVDAVGQPASGASLNQNDDLDRKADVAKRETQAKRKQIPPFVQKLSR
jgi:heat shock transcription factor